MKRNRGFAAVTAAEVFFLLAAGPAWAVVEFDAGQSLDVKEFLSEARASQAPETPTPRIVLAGYVAANDPQAGKPGQEIEWATIDGGSFAMGTDDGDINATPVHEVVIKTFEMSKTLVTVEQYAECVNKRSCTEPLTGDYCNWGKKDRQRHPINCVNWVQANQYAKFKGARLPSEAEWEYAATSGGRNQKYPWGMAKATCEYAVMYEEGHAYVGDRDDARYHSGNYGCGTGGTMPVCSKPAGKTAQGLCDMAGNVSQWVQDTWHRSYAGAPADGKPWEDASPFRVTRGGSYFPLGDHAYHLRADFRDNDFFDGRGDTIGFRLARASRPKSVKG